MHYLLLLFMHLEKRKLQLHLSHVPVTLNLICNLSKGTAICLYKTYIYIYIKMQDLLSDRLSL